MSPRGARRDLRGQAGFTLIELLIGMTLSLFLLGATLTAFDAFSQATIRNDKVTGAEDSARNRIDRMTASLRNAAGASGNSPVVVAGAYDLVVNTDRPGFGQASGSAGTARYCLDTSTQGKLWFGWTPTPNVNPGATCPAAGWTNVVILGSGVTNQTSGNPLFTYASATPSAVRAARIDLRLSTHGSKTTRLQSGVFFRSLAQTAPTPGGGSVTSGTCTGNVVTLNVGSALSTDINGDPQRIEVTDTDTGVQIATGVGSHTITLPTGVNHIRTRVFNVLGQFADINNTVTC
jgi:prepilin-type N-terminal cleavage/methylation domain-containing protein